MLHRLEPIRPNLHGQFSAALKPALTVRSGDTVAYRTLDVGWGLEPPTSEIAPRRKLEPRSAPHDDGPCLIGPTAVEGARPGDALEIHIEEVRPGPTGWTWAGDIGAPDSRLNEALGIAEGPPVLIRWEIDPDEGTATTQDGQRVRIRPFLGTIGLCPAGDGWHSGWLPRRTGGNLDCRELVAGSVLVLPVEVEGAFVSLGDGHAAQGDGEVSGTAVECGMDLVRLRYVLRREPRIPHPHAITPAGWLTFGFAASLDEAAHEAIAAMADLISLRFGIDRKKALALASAVVDVRVTQMVNRIRGVHALLPHDAIEQRNTASTSS